jgi:hypothetical protein
MPEERPNVKRWFEERIYGDNDFSLDEMEHIYYLFHSSDLDEDSELSKKFVRDNNYDLERWNDFMDHTRRFFFIEVMYGYKYLVGMFDRHVDAHDCHNFLSGAENHAFD